MRKKISFFIVSFCFVMISSVCSAQTAKYVFFIIGDGMGVNQVNGTEMYMGEKDGKIGTEALRFTKFPTVSMATTFSATNSVTDSAAGGTALSTGSKTHNLAVGVDVDNKPLVTIAERAKSVGYKVGIATTVSIDHATPAVFYAHQPQRSMYYQIATELPKSNFDFFAGSGFIQPTDPKDKSLPTIYSLFDKANYTVAKGYTDYLSKMDQAEKMILIQEDGADNHSCPYAIDSKPSDLNISKITDAALSFLQKGEDKGFFLMLEGGKIDWACHSNDAATAFNEVMDMNKGVEKIYQFYLQHPTETLIVITADHETGGLALGTGKYELNLKALASQKLSQEELSNKIKAFRKKNYKTATWKAMKALLSENLGFWNEVSLSKEQTSALKEVYKSSFSNKTVKFAESMYAKDEPLAAAAIKMMNSIAYVGWASHGHSDGYVPVYAIGVGAELFQGKLDNTDIPKKIIQAAKY
ncbi:MAG: alkaline phosphatase [Bacteroidaceae bacterium]